jgi:hypothetical protein
MVNWKKKYLKYKIKYKNLYAQKAGGVNVQLDDYYSIELDILSENNLRIFLEKYIEEKYNLDDILNNISHQLSDDYNYSDAEIAIILSNPKIFESIDNIKIKTKQELIQLDHGLSDNLLFAGNSYKIRSPFGQQTLPIEEGATIKLINVPFYLYSFLITEKNNYNYILKLLFYNLLNKLEEQNYLYIEEDLIDTFDMIAISEIHSIFKSTFIDEKYIKKITLYIDDLKSYKLYVNPQSKIYETLVNFFNNYEANLKFAKKNQDNIQNPDDIYNEEDIFEKEDNIYLYIENIDVIDEQRVFENINNDDLIGTNVVKFNLNPLDRAIPLNTTITWHISKSENIEPNKFTYLYLFIIKHNNFLRNNVHSFVINANIKIEILQKLLDIIDDRYYRISLQFYQLPSSYKVPIKKNLKQYAKVYIDDIIKYISELEELEEEAEREEILDNKIEILENILKKIKIYYVNFITESVYNTFEQITYKLDNINRFIKDNIKLTDLEYNIYNEINDVNITRKLAKYMRLAYKFPLEIQFYN